MEKIILPLTALYAKHLSNAARMLTATQVKLTTHLLLAGGLKKVDIGLDQKGKAPSLAIQD